MISNDSLTKQHFVHYYSQQIQRDSAGKPHTNQQQDRTWNLPSVWPVASMLEPRVIRTPGGHFFMVTGCDESMIWG